MLKIYRWYLLADILKIDVKSVFLVRFHIFSQDHRRFRGYGKILQNARSIKVVKIKKQL